MIAKPYAQLFRASRAYSGQNIRKYKKRYHRDKQVRLVLHKHVAVQKNAYQDKVNCVKKRYLFFH
jgi:D-tyrosyl-tRNA(Tyr) deacylase